MATPEQIAQLRTLIAEPDNVEPYTDAALGLRLDADAGDPRSLAADVWREKAAGYTSLVDVKEGNSSRSLSQLSKQALTMATALDGEVSADAGVARRGSRTRLIERQ